MLPSGHFAKTFIFISQKHCYLDRKIHCVLCFACLFCFCFYSFFIVFFFLFCLDGGDTGFFCRAEGIQCLFLLGEGNTVLVLGGQMEYNICF